MRAGHNSTWTHLLSNAGYLALSLRSTVANVFVSLGKYFVSIAYLTQVILSSCKRGCYHWICDTIHLPTAFLVKSKWLWHGLWQYSYNSKQIIDNSTVVLMKWCYSSSLFSWISIREMVLKYPRSKTIRKTLLTKKPHKKIILVCETNIPIFWNISRECLIDLKHVLWSVLDLKLAMG